MSLLLLSERGTNASPENSDTEPPLPYCYGLRHDNRWVKRRPRAHRRRFARSPPLPKPRWSQDRGRREQSKEYTMRGVPQRFDSNSTCQNLVDANPFVPRRSQTRKQVFESPCRIAKPGGAVIIRGALQKFFIKASSETRADEFSKCLLSLWG